MGKKITPLRKLRFFRWLRGVWDFAIDSLVLALAIVGLILGIPAFILIWLAYSLNQRGIR